MLVGYSIIRNSRSPGAKKRVDVSEFRRDGKHLAGSRSSTIIAIKGE
jgi:hypothetical protein